ncbi:MAG: hypothetical protein IPM42_19995 [Saprospiraceae bacterium]|nr:hypothetical protein [Saprospiraceae bacterium]
MQTESGIFTIFSISRSQSLSVSISKIANAFLLLFFSSVAFSQLPSTNLYLAELKFSGNSVSIKDISFLSDFNKKGYNNQPFLLNYQELYITSAIDTQKITDIYQLNIKTKVRTRFTDTEMISEFSPTPTPDGNHLTVVRIEADGQTQSLWKYPKDRSNIGYRLLPEINNVGYHCWLSESEVALFLVGDPHELVIANITTKTITPVIDNIGRCIKKDENNRLYFVHKLNDDNWFLKVFDKNSKQFSTICQMPKGSEDFEFLNNGSVLVGNGAKLLTFSTTNNDGWKEISDFKKFGINNISRLSAIRDRLVFVSSN